MPANVSLILKSLAFAALFAQTAAAQKAAVPPAAPPRGPFTCTELIGLYSSGEWWDAGFYDGLGALKTRWQGRFSHYGYTYEYANPGSYAWSPVNVGGVNNVRLTAPCAQNGNAPDRIVYQAWSWQLTSEKAWVDQPVPCRDQQKRSPAPCRDRRWRLRSPQLRACARADTPRSHVLPKRCPSHFCRSFGA